MRCVDNGCEAILGGGDLYMTLLGVAAVVAWMMVIKPVGEIILDWILNKF